MCTECVTKLNQEASALFQGGWAAEQLPIVHEDGIDILRASGDGDIQGKWRTVPDIRRETAESRSGFGHVRLWE
jgi:hypothetical protein